MSDQHKIGYTDGYNDGYSDGHDDGLVECEEARKENIRLHADLAAVTAERNRMREALRDCVAALKHPIRRINNDGLLLHDIKFEVGRDMAVNAALHRARAAIEGVTEKEGAGNE